MLNEHQYEQLLKPLNPNRVAKRSQAGRSLSYLEAWDVKAHLIRIFGFGGWSWDVLTADLAFESEKDGKWNVGYKVKGSLHIPSLGCSYTEASVGAATLPQRGEAHDMAVKTGESDALKRAAINLGTQFGLSLYDNGALKDVVGKTLDRDGQPANPVTDTSDAVEDTDGAEAWVMDMKTAIEGKDIDRLINMKQAMNTADANDWTFQGMTLAKWLDKAVAAVGKEK
jgi:recombination DNA repair RAD52 pathway protein